MSDLARELVALPGFRWMPGMLATPVAYRCVGIYGEPLLPYGTCEDEGAEQELWPFAHDWLPDLTDPATLGCLLALVREAWGDVWAYVAPHHNQGGSSWMCWVTGPGGMGDHFYGPDGTVAAALVAAFRAAP